MPNFYENLRNNISTISNTMGWGDYYKCLEAHRGSCLGLALMWVQAVLCNDRYTFNRRMNLLTQYYSNPQELTDKINRIREEIRNGCSSVTLEEYDLIEIRAFLDGLLLFQLPNNTSLSSELPPNQTFLASRYVIPESITVPDEQTGLNKPLQCIYHKLWCETISEITLLLSNLLREVRLFIPTTPFAVVLESENHSIAVTVINNNIILYDANLMIYNQIEGNITDNVEGYINDAFYFNFIDTYKLDLFPVSVSVYISPCVTFPQEVKDFNIYGEQPNYELYLMSIIDKQYHLHTHLLSMACMQGHTEVVDELLKRGADPNQTHLGFTLLYIACQNGYTQIVNILLNDPRIDPNQIVFDSTPLYIACQRGYTQIVRLLLAHPGIDPNQTKNGVTPLYTQVARDLGCP